MGTQPRVIVEISGCLNTNPLREGPESVQLRLGKLLKILCVLFSLYDLPGPV